MEQRDSSDRKVCSDLYQSQSIISQMDFFAWQERSRGFRGMLPACAAGVTSHTIDKYNAAKGKKTRFHRTLWIGIGIGISSQPATTSSSSWEMYPNLRSRHLDGEWLANGWRAC